MEHLGNGEADAEGGQEKMHREDGMQEGQGAFAGHRRLCRMDMAGAGDMENMECVGNRGNMECVGSKADME